MICIFCNSKAVINPKIFGILPSFFCNNCQESKCNVEMQIRRNGETRISFHCDDYTLDFYTQTKYIMLFKLNCENKGNFNKILSINDFDTPINPLNAKNIIERIIKLKVFL